MMFSGACSHEAYKARQHERVKLRLLRDEDEPLLEVVDSQPGIAIATSSGRKFVRYRPDGSASGTDLTYTICDRRGAGEAAAVIVSNPGTRVTS